MQIRSIIKGLMQGTAVLLIILGVVYAVDYQLNKDDPYFEDPDTVELTYGVATYFFVIGGILLLFGIFYRENVDLVVNLVVTFFLVLAVYTGHRLAVIGMKRDLLSYGSYKRPELIIYLGALLFLVGLVALILVWIHVAIKLFRKSAN
ncbi:hypothetical protein GBV73_09440 [Thermococcus sp. 101 C5]|uniref:hypothetical protein n=1 Tax=Thermococcus sp. 101 C5 TaxID=2654197 RepID=UPI00128E5FDE|nr:hypothetical protein [Thermococcus sp. 101 C5]MPW39882.1 hypothetical protein [Thermococcus sp. 101 C5]